MVTSTIVFEEKGELREYVGGYSDWLRQGKALAEVDDPSLASGVNSTPAKNQPKQKPKKLSYNEQRELDQLPRQIEELETKVESLLEIISASDFYSQDHDKTGPVLQEFTESQQALDLVLERWTALEDQQQKYQSSRP